MAQQSLDNPQADNQRVEQGALVPEDEKFWRRYSPHHEFPLSSTASIALHFLAIAVLVLGAVLAAKWGLSDSEKPLPISMMDEPGGGGEPEGKDTGTGAGVVQSKEATESPSNAVPQASPTPKENLDVPKVDPLTLPQVQDPSNRYIGESSEAMKELAKLDEQTRKNLFNSLRDPPKGKGGSGSGGGKGAGTGTGTGSGTGHGEGTLTKRQRRKLRWVIGFQLTAFNDRALFLDHLRQLAALQAVLAIPDPSGRCYVYHDLNGRPPQGRLEDISKMDRIWFTDHRRETTTTFAKELNLPFIPPRLIVFFPRELEERLAKMEEEFRGQKEDEIREHIRFLVVPRRGTYDVTIDPDQSGSEP